MVTFETQKLIFGFIGQITKVYSISLVQDCDLKRYFIVSPPRFFFTFMNVIFYFTSAFDKMMIVSIKRIYRL